MANQAVARRYAEALFDIARDKGLLDQVDDELGMVVNIIDANPQLQAALGNVLIPAEAKRNVVSKVFSGKVSDLVLNFLLVLIRKRREAQIPAIYREYLELANKARGIVEVEVRSAIPLPDDTVRNLEAKLVQRLGKRVKFQTQVAPELLGGLVVRVGDELIDGSVKTRLQRMRERLIHSKS